MSLAMARAFDPGLAQQTRQTGLKPQQYSAETEPLRP
jgi:hypothetical protein